MYFMSFCIVNMKIKSEENESMIFEFRLVCCETTSSEESTDINHMLLFKNSNAVAEWS